ncbi:chemotaxis protein CheW [Alteromonas sp. ASW11-130]|uniref:chemotaxis protein CheW n=1 Tax=Alteromonas sp. ASW11-130 TaxID=3015775 RepID=UPI002241D8C2|nr:chemotaxis protein CheW [Alteromonas sp. ASW11-130]MCW8090381.1 chemotaxis protein CheW [Alteromonas sp. ASW11-130]
MSKSTPFAKEDVMEAYLDSLLHGPEDPTEVTARTAKLLEKASLDIVKEEVPATTPAPPVDESVIDEEALAETSVVATPPPEKIVPVHELLEEQFQALFFEVAGLTMAVPLITLGGIHRLEKVGPLIGKPKWFKGVMLHREQKLNVVDTAMWVMPEKYDQKLAEALNYQYLIMLGDSAWGLASDKLVNTITLRKNEVKWRESTGKRPWLAGMVKNKMCALVDVHHLISMLNKGLGSNDNVSSNRSQVNE